MKAPACEIFILAGGLSARMGRDKSRVQLANRTLLQHVRNVAGTLKLPVRIIRRDAVPRCGPLGGIYTGLKRTRADGAMFLACDMPFVSADFLGTLLEKFHSATSHGAIFAQEVSRAGFPCVLPRTALAIVASQIANSDLSLQSLAKRLGARTLRPAQPQRQLFNVNRPGDLRRAQKMAQA